MPRIDVYILLGTNLGDRERNLAAAHDRIELIPGLEIVAASSLYITDPVGMEPGAPAFLNQVVKGEYIYPVNELFIALQHIESALGRTDKGLKKPRTIDLDILLFGDTVMDTPDLTIPHRELLNRPFAMVPLLQIDPDLVHPVTRKPIASYVTDQARQHVLLFKDHVARHR